MKELVEMNKTGTKKERQYLAGILFTGATVISGTISALSPQITDPTISQLLIPLSKAFVWLLVLTPVSFVVEFLWRKWLRAKWDTRKKTCIEWFQKEIRTAINAETASYQQDLQTIRQNTQNLCSVASEAVIIDTVQKKIIDPIHRDIRQQTEKIVNKLSNSIAVPVQQSVEISREIHIALKEANFKFLQTDATPLESYVKDHSDISRILIICYGRNGYNQAFRYIEDHKKTIDCEIIVCNPKHNNAISAPGDEDAIAKQIASIKRQNGSGKRNIYISNIVPTIRAVILYAKDQAVWVSYEPYIFNVEGDHMVLRRAGSASKSRKLAEGEEAEDVDENTYNGTLIVELDKENTIKKDEFKNAVEYIEQEFNRLKSESVPYQRGKVHFQG